MHLQLRVRERTDNLAPRIRPQPTAGDSGVAAEMPSFASGSLDPTVHSAFHNAPMGVAVTRLDGVIVACNPALGELIGTDPAALLGGALYDVIHPDDVDDARQHCATMLANELRVMRHECRFRAHGSAGHLGVDQYLPGARHRGRSRAQGHPRREHQRTQEARGRAQPPGPARSAHRAGEPRTAQRADPRFPVPPRPPRATEPPVLSRPRRLQGGERPVRPCRR